MKNKKILIILIALLSIVSIFIGWSISILTFNMETGILLPSFTWIGKYERHIDSENYGFPFFIRSCSPSPYDVSNKSDFLIPFTEFCPINLFAWGLNIFFYSSLTLLIFYIIKRIFWHIKKTK